MAGSRSAPTYAELAAAVPSEAGLETNVVRYLANCIERRMRLPEGGVEITVPTQHQEKHLGYDASVGLPPGHYVLLQFKRPYKPSGCAASFRLQTEQLRTLLGNTTESAFYVLPPVETNRDMWGARAGLLDRTCLVDAWDLLEPLCGGGGMWAGSGGVKKQMTIRIDGCDPCAASVLAGPRGRVPVGAQPARTLCGAQKVGFVVASGGKIKTRGGAEWNRAAWRAEVAKRLGRAKGSRGGPAGARMDGMTADIIGYLERGVAEPAGSGGRGGTYLLRRGGAS